MNCGTFQIQRIEAALKEVLATFDAKECANCDQPLLDLAIVSDEYHCPACGAAVCVLCGCTEQNACTGGCSWVMPGICSTHDDALDAALARQGIRFADAENFQ